MFIYFVRHGLSQNNIEGKIQGAGDPLSKVGESQANDVAQKLKQLPVEAIYSSDFARAHRTAEIIGQALGREVIATSLLRETSRPTALHDVVAKDPAAQLYYQSRHANLDDPQWKHSDEESFHELSERGQKCLDWLISLPDEHNVVVTHGNFLRILIGLMMFSDRLTPRLFYGLWSTMKASNTGISTCEFGDEKWELLTWNDYAHVSEIS